MAVATAPATAPSLGKGNRTRVKLDSLTGLRFFAALGVVCYHVGGVALSHVSPVARSVSEKGYIAVGFFYVLSGFVLAYSHYRRDHAPRPFWIARIARIFPLYALAQLLAIPSFASHIHTGSFPAASIVWSLVLSPVLLQSWLPWLALAWNSPAWSLSVEAFFYFLFPYIFLPLRRLRRSTCLWLILVLYLAQLAPSITYCITHPLSFTELIYRNNDAWRPEEASGFLGFINYGPLLRLPEFVIGILLGCLFVTRPPKESKANGRRWNYDCLALLSMVLLAVFLVTPRLVPYPIVHNGLLTPVWCLLIFAFASGARLATVFAFRPLVILGEASYGIYILQQPLSSLFKALLKVMHIQIVGDYPSVALLLAYVLVLCGFCIASYRFVEIPARNWINRYR